jgi:hypothetical protein
MTNRGLNATAALRFPQRGGRYRPHRPYRPNRRNQPAVGHFSMDGMSAACAQTVHDALNRAPTFAHRPRGRQASTPWPSRAPVGDIGQRRPPLAAQRVGTTSPGHRARAAGTVAKIGRVCLRARKGGGRTGGCPTAARTTRDRPAWRPRFYPAKAAGSSGGGPCED